MHLTYPAIFRVDMTFTLIFTLEDSTDQPCASHYNHFKVVHVILKIQGTICRTWIETSAENYES